jgi:hypothetical protein
MKVLTIIHSYLLIGALAGLLFGFSSIKTTLLPFCIYLALTGYLVFLFFKRSPTLLFNSLLLLFMLQLISIKTIALGYFLGIGLCFLISFGIDPISARETLFGISYSDFSPVAEGQKQMVGINLLALVMLLLLILTKEK